MLRNTIAGGVPGRRATFTAFLVLISIFVLVLTADTAAAGKGWAKGRILVAPGTGASASEFDKAVKSNGGRSLGRLRRLGVHVVAVPANSEEKIARRLAKHPHVRFAELDVAVPLSDIIPNDTYYPNAWHLPKIGAPAAWEGSKGNGVTVAVLDTGVDPDHPDLAAQLVAGWNSSSENTTTSDVNGHGTYVSGVVAAISNNNLGVASVAWQAKIMPIRVTDSSDGYAYFSRIASGLTWAADNGAKVANISYHVSGSSTVGSAAQYMQGRGGVVVVAAGNYGDDPGFADSPYMISVAATGSSDTRASWSCYGSYVDVCAPGVGIWTTSNGGGYGSVSGTSFSSPLTAAVVALIMAADTTLTPAQVESVLEANTDDLGTTGWDAYYGYGRINAAKAVAAALNNSGGGDPDPDTQAPASSITSPTGGTVYGTTTVYVTATDNVGVTKVEFCVDGSLVATDTQAPYQFAWDTTDTADGSAALTACAYDAAGNQTTSTAVNVTVDNAPAPGDTTAPTVSIGKPADGETVSGRVRISVSAGDDTGVTSLKLYIDGNQVASGTTAALNHTWNTKKVAGGSHTIRAVATDAAGNTGTKTITVTVGSSSSGDERQNPGKGKKK